ncbi:alpha/beta-hydrolase [Westerdykella ornata]|uniref:Alpha/beta-hydrolase n=1 Tax=Westerdykella ornata TaxID=318751 RepID=A0A6A6JBE9_WESOR|nr:alpha/beta-hydrolase [Westerdykella ornata]KAF2273752.1 alpha/beta-hydrolase [Westerdykella ornata]
MQTLARHACRIRSLRSPGFQWQCARSFHASASYREVVDLAYELHDNGGKATGAPIVFLHGLFGSKRNNRSMSKALARELSRPIYNVDLRNHGDSSHAKEHNYTALAEDTEAFMKKHSLKDATLIGHSMGAKTVMTVALRNPDNCTDIIAVDNAPVDAALTSDFPLYVEGMRRVEEAKASSLKEADAILEPYAKDVPVRQFLLTNLIRPAPNAPLKFRIPVRTLANALDDMADFPFTDPDKTRFNKRALFVRGTRSHYVPDETIPIIGRFFPRFDLVDIESGHWVITENPEAFFRAVVEFLNKEEDD